jgi:Domain of unknown function (DUF5666)
MKTTAKIVVAGVSTVALAGGIGAGIAYADPPSPTPTPTASASPAPTAQPTDNDQRKNLRKKRPLLARALHGEVTLAGDKHRVVVFQRGPIEKVSDTSMTIKSPDGYTATYAISAETKVRKNKAKATVTDLKTGDRVFVVANKDGATLEAFRIRVIHR